VSIGTIPLVVSLLLGVAAVEAAPVSVRLLEGNTRGHSSSDRRMGR
jgi:hypothetical protein